MSDKLDLESKDLIADKLNQLQQLFPNLVTEGENGKVLDLDQLKNEFSTEVVEGTKERYRLEWPGKKEAIVTAHLPTPQTLRPVKEDSVDFDNTENLYIEGDNLEVLKVLQESYFGKIKMIYIDPPYNTGKDFVYKDNFSKDAQEELEESGQKDEYNQRLFQNVNTEGRYHSDWLTMLYPRIKLGRNLLEDNGVFLMSIDDNEVENARKICDEIFGEMNFVESIIWKKKYGGGAKTKYYVGLHEYILVYAKNIDSIDNITIPYQQETIDRYYKHEDDKLPLRGPYRLQPLATNSNELRPNLRYPILHKNKEVWPDKQWQWSKERTDKAYSNNELVFTEKSEGISVNFKQYLKDEKGNMRRSKPTSLIEGVYTQHGTSEIKDLFGDGQIFSFPKPSNLLEHVAKAFLDDGDTFLDFFSGSSSSAHGILKLNSNGDLNGQANFIQVQIPEQTPDTSSARKMGYEVITDIAKERIRRAGAKIKEETGADIDYGFRVYRLDESNMADVYHRPQDYDQNNLELFADNVKEGRTADDLLAQIMLDWGLPLSLPIEETTIAGKRVFNVAGNSLMACFETGIDEAFAKQVAEEEPLRIVFKDAGFASDTAKSNVKQLLKQLSPETEMKVI